ARRFRMTGDIARGRLKIEWARTHMPVLGGVRRRFESERPLAGLTVAAVLHVEAKTCVLALALKAGGADVRLAAGNPLSTDDDVVAAVREEGVPTWAEKGETVAQYKAGIQIGRPVARTSASPRATRSPPTMTWSPPCARKGCPRGPRRGKPWPSTRPAFRSEGRWRGRPPRRGQPALHRR